MSLTEILTLPDYDAVVELRPARLSDVYSAVELVDVPDDMTDSQPRRLAYQMRVDDMQVLMQIQSVDGQPVADVRELAAQLSPDDMTALSKAATALKKKPKPVSEPSPVTEFSKQA